MLEGLLISAFGQAAACSCAKATFGYFSLRSCQATRVKHPSPDRTRARELFGRLAELPQGDPDRLRTRAELVELHLPLVEYLA